MSSFEATVAGLIAQGRLFDKGSTVYISRAPGRLDLMGGNVDYTGGLVFQATIREATWCAAQKRSDQRILLSNPQMANEGWSTALEFDLSALTSEEEVRRLVNATPASRWTAYVLGIFYLLRLKFPEKASTGITAFIASEVPLNKGVSSSAAIEVAVMKAAAAAYGINLHGIELAEYCQWVENVIAESACGIMDQAASVLGEEGCVLPLLCQPCTPKPLVRLPEALQCWAIDSGVRHAVTGIEYEAARAAVFVGFRLICEWEGLALSEDCSGRIPRFTDPRWNGYPSNITPSLFRSKYEARLPEIATGAEILATRRPHIDPFTLIRPEVSYRIRNCTRYAIEENQRIQLFYELAQNSARDASEASFQLMGDLMFQSHWSYTECGLGCDATDLLIQLVRQECGPGKLYGAKITGGGGGGTVAVLGARGAEPHFRSVVEKYANARGYAPYVFEGSSMGADRFGIRPLRGNA